MIAVLIAEHLDLDVAGRADVFLNKNRAIAKGGNGFAYGQLHLLFKAFHIFHHAHALAASAGTGLDQDRKADSLASSLAAATSVIASSVPGTIGML